MGEWHGHGKTGLNVGFKQQGYFDEAGHCFHLRFGMQAFGYSSKKAPDGRIKMHLKCEECFEVYVKERQSQAVCCNDCNSYMPRSNTQLYVPYDREGMSEEEAQLIICHGCWEGEVHQLRLSQDAEKQMEDSDGEPDLWDPGLGLECVEETPPLVGDMECSDCGGEFHPSALKRYVPADRGEGELENQVLYVCPDCREEPRHQARLHNDRLDRQNKLERRSHRRS